MIPNPLDSRRIASSFFSKITCLAFLEKSAEITCSISSCLSSDCELSSSVDEAISFVGNNRDAVFGALKLFSATSFINGLDGELKMWRSCCFISLEKVSFFVQRTINWEDKTSSVRIVDQTLLPKEFRFVKCRTVRSLIHAIKSMQIRGAPAIGVAGAMGVALSFTEGMRERKSDARIASKVQRESKALISARPTAVNLSWGVKSALEFLSALPSKMSSKEKQAKLVEFVKLLADKDVNVNKELSKIGQVLIKDNASILTHCN